MDISQRKIQHLDLLLKFTICYQPFAINARPNCMFASYQIQENCLASTCVKRLSSFEEDATQCLGGRGTPSNDHTDGHVQPFGVWF